ncbi:HAMP domain-containing histidine kinase [Cohaesibacter sp. CAU 1516]|uniref:sensor histidine kinase n=1 Tax=Cohaesibacter sp. CAU 1516 TaxID=2576038 RepID=UPI0010FD726D|nr:HAMP domain-containing sensor histidine kinase [Cohaesibacter sp. CAU 1516]TLP43338.1 HAMP domain-containing histidine kinase [Cohaesibacter sp. CAU 1516]
MAGGNTSKRSKKDADGSSARAARRRAVLRTVHDVREQLNSEGGYRPSFRHELLMMYAQNRTSAHMAVPMLLLTVGAISTLWADPAHSLLWILAALLTHAMMYVIARRFEKLSADDVDLESWNKRFLLWEGVSGLVWASILVLPTTKDAAYLAEYHFAIMLVVVAMTTMLSFSIPAAVWVGALPISVFIVFEASVNVEVVDTTLSLMSIGAMVFFLSLSKRLYSSTLAMLNFRMEKDFLITELEQAKAVSDESRRQAEEANTAKSRFLATMSHELRTPLNAILGFSEIMQNEVLGPLPNEKYKEYVGDIHSSGSHLLNLINEILDLSRIEAGRYKLNEEAVTLAYVAEDCENLLRLRARAKDITIKLDIKSSLPKVWADERAIRQITLNLLTNAVKFTPKGGTIVLSVHASEEGGQYISVEDNGPGIPEEEISTVLSAFGQGTAAIQSAEEGSGLGLSIVQALVEMHDGSFDLKSVLRKGTKVTATFPPARVMDVTPPATKRPRIQLKRTG